MSNTSSASRTKINLDLSSIFEPVRNEMAVVEKCLRNNLIDDDFFVNELLADIFKPGGKRIRPGLVLLCNQAIACSLDVDVAESAAPAHIILAVLTELIHSASLVHDDVIDRAKLRRGAETIHCKFNERVAVLVGDLLFAQASICLAQLGSPEIVGIYGRVLGDLCAGEIKQLRRQYVVDVDWDAYIAKCFCKTASLFSAGCRSAAILNHSTDEIVAELQEFGKNLGICFQIVDDLLDITASDEMLGKPAGSDLAGGIVTAPALIVLERGDAPAKRLASLVTSRAVNDNGGLSDAIELIKAHGGIEGSLELCCKYARAAQKNLAIIDDCAAKASLNEAVDHLLYRAN